MIKLEFTVRLRFGHEHAAQDAPAEWRESQGSLVETYPQPRYVGFEAIEP